MIVLYTFLCQVIGLNNTFLILHFTCDDVMFLKMQDCMDVFVSYNRVSRGMKLNISPIKRPCMINYISLAARFDV